ncbi:MAG: DNA translocase FtsK, partial [Spirochaetales bacterium]
MTDRDSSALGLSVILYATAGFAALAISLALIAPDAQHLLLILLRAPGRFLFSSFHLAAFYVPAVFVTGASLLLSPSFKPVHVWGLLYSVLPFFTLALLIRILARAAVDSSPITDALVGALGRWGALSILTAAAVLELALFWIYLHRRPRPLTGGIKRIPRLLTAERSPASDGTPDGEWEAVATRSSRNVTPRSLVDLPTPPAEPAVDHPPVDHPPVDHPPVDGPVSGIVAQPPADGPPANKPELEVFFSHGRIEPHSDCAAGDDADDVEIDELEAEELDAAWARSEAQHSRTGRRTRGDGVSPSKTPEDVPDAPADQIELDEKGEDADPADQAESDAPKVPRPRSKRYDVPVSGLLQEYSNGHYWQIDDKTREAAETLRITLEEFGIQAEVTGIRKGPVITMFEILPAPGVKLSKIVNLSDNIALRLAASSVRIVAPIPGKHAVGIEIPNKERAIVGFAELVQEEAFQAPRMEVPIALGKDIPGDAEIVDLTRMPHVLIAGATGSGKSVCVNSIICSILYRRAPHEVKLVLIDPKIVELKFYNDIPHLLTPVITDPKRAFQALQWCIYEMERRYSLLDALQAGQGQRETAVL